MTYTCKFSGYPEKREQRKRNTKSFRQGCPFEVCFGLSEHGHSLIIKKLNEVHTHLVFEELYKRMPHASDFYQMISKKMWNKRYQ